AGVVIAALMISIVSVAATPDGVAAAAVRVRAPEGSAHGFLVLRAPDGSVLAHGDWWQIPDGDRLEVHLRFRFTDGSLSHETFELAQRRVWSLLSYRSVQNGPRFPRDIEAHLDRTTGRYRVETKERGKGERKADEGTIDLPEDTYGFGMLAMLLKSLPPGESMTAHAVAFTPKPRVLTLNVSPDGEEQVKIERLAR